MEVVGITGEVESERGCCAARRIREARRDSVLSSGRPAAVGDRKRTFENREGSHVEDVAAWLSARQAVIDEIQQRLFHLVGMRRHVGEVAAEGLLYGLRMAQVAH